MTIDAPRVHPRRRCRRTRDLMPLHYYGALAGRRLARLVRHIASCAGCAREWDETRHALSTVERSAAFPREMEVDWEGFARETVLRARAAAARSEPKERPGRWRFPAPGTLVPWAVAAAAVIVGLILIPVERTTPPKGEQAAQAPEHSTSEAVRSLRARLAQQGATRYLREGRTLLTELVRSPIRCKRASDRYDVVLEKERSLQLMRRQKLYIGLLDGEEDRRLSYLVDDLQSLLLEVAFFGDCVTAGRIRELREAMQRRQILLRIDLVTREVEGRPFRV